MNNDLMQVLNESRIIFIDDVIDAKMANYVVTKLIYFGSLGNEDITIYINSPGGSVADGLAIIDVMRLVKSKVNTIGYGTVASMAGSSQKNGKRSLSPDILRTMMKTKEQSWPMNYCVRFIKTTITMVHFMMMP